MNTSQYRRAPAGMPSGVPSRAFAIVGSVLAAVLVLIVAAGALVSGFDKTAGGEVGVVRNGGWLDDNRVRQVVPAGSARTWTGLYSTMHRYPAQQRFYTITADPARGDKTGVDVVNTPSSDGVEMGIEGTIYFTLNLNAKALEQFDTKFGTRQFRGVDGTLRYAYDGDEGWSSFLDAIVRPVIDNDLRIQISKFRCAELVSSCALVQNGAQRAPAAGPGDPDAAGQANNTNIAKVQEAVNESLPKDLAEMLGGDFFEGIKFNLARVTLPQAVQEAVNKAQAAYAAVSEAQAKVAQARAEADANKTRQQGYNACSACAQIDIIKALPPGVTTYAPGAGATVPLK
ncbi:SPFH domain-containing protein [Micromonospora mirobrigensis]|uniref:SPFH domain / Band 7 family protein n=1 Tax=Micromonospora mirobrigensis TaxID=262898 RepID=A0A1C4WFB6_9ACTN|nr:SPFH domain-containing protein [Micromonospora mirobrigensis]SCE94927.1 SPFH domain / Band 7 family protein [Micromonospora mirobrigensis]